MSCLYPVYISPCEVGHDYIQIFFRIMSDLQSVLDHLADDYTYSDGLTVECSIFSLNAEVTVGSGYTRTLAQDN